MIFLSVWFFWAYDFSERMIFLSVWFCVRMICVHMIFLWVWSFLSVWFVCVWFFCAYDFHNYAPVPVAYRKNSNKWTMYSDFLNFRLWKHRFFYSLLHLLGVCTSDWADKGQKIDPVRTIPHAVPGLYWAFSNQSMVARHSLRYTLLTWHLRGMSWPLG